MCKQKTLTRLTHQYFEKDPMNSIYIRSSATDVKRSSEEYMTSTLSNSDKILRQIQSLGSNHASTASDCRTPADTTVTIDMFTDDDDDVSLMSSDDDADEIVLFTPAKKNDRGELKQVSLELTKPFILMPKTSSPRSVYESLNSSYFDISLPVTEDSFNQE